jgi:hypothetical protein
LWSKKCVSRCFLKTLISINVSRFHSIVWGSKYHFR